MRPQPNAILTVLGIETSCDETAAGVVRRDADGHVEVLSSIVLSQVKDHAPFGGVVPEIAARAHVEAIDAVIKAAMTEAGLGFDDLDGVAAMPSSWLRSSPAVVRASSTSPSMRSRWARAAISGTTPPKRRCSVSWL